MPDVVVPIPDVVVCMVTLSVVDPMVIPDVDVEQGTRGCPCGCPVRYYLALVSNVLVLPSLRITFFYLLL